MAKWWKGFSRQDFCFDSKAQFNSLSAYFFTRKLEHLGSCSFFCFLCLIFPSRATWLEIEWAQLFTI